MAASSPQTLFEIDQLRCFVAAAEQHSFKQAAILLHVSQPLVSQQIADLEQQVGKKLFIRGRQSVELTQAGTVMLAKTRDILAHVSGIASTVRTAHMDVATSGKLRIAIEQLFDHSIVAQSVFQFRTQNPEVEIELQIMRMSDIILSLSDQSIDIGMCVLPLGNLNAQLEYRVLAQERLCFVASSHLIHSKKPDCFFWVADCLPCCLLERDYRGTNAAVQICLSMDISPRFLFFNDIESILLQVESGTGFTILPDRAVSAFARKNISVIPLEDHAVAQLLLAPLWNTKNPNPLIEPYLQSIFKNCPPDIAGLRQESLRPAGSTAKKAKTMVLM